MTHYETIHTETREGFQIVFSVTPEDMNPRGHFDDEQIDEVLESIESDKWQWFVARVQAYKNGVLLGTDYLGGCLYPSFLEFITAADYYEDMVTEVIREAKQTIQELTEVTQ